MSAEVGNRLIAKRAAVLGMRLSVGIGVALPGLTRAAITRSGAGEHARQDLRRLLIRLGPSFVKGAQILSTRRDVLPDAWCDALSQLHDRVPPMPRRQAAAVLAASFPAGEVREEDLAWDAVASGSIACVYPAVLSDGREVAVKVQRPGVAAELRADFALLGAGARLMQRLPALSRVPAVQMVAQIGAAVCAQSDFPFEVQALTALRENLARLDYVRVPQPHVELCRPAVIVMSFLPGLEPSHAQNAEGNDEAFVKLLAERALTCVYRMLFIDGLVHCDMHPGNLYLNPDGTVVLLDAGFVVRLEPRVRGQFAEFFLAMARGDGTACAEIVVASAARVPDDADLDAFRIGVIELIRTSTRQRAGLFSLVNFTTTLFDLQRRSGIFAAPEFVFPLLALLVLEGRIRDLHSDIDFQQAAMPILLEALRLGLTEAWHSDAKSHSTV